MTILCLSDLFLAHDTGLHPENRGRLEAIHQKLAANPNLTANTIRTWQPATSETIALAHDAAYVKSVAEWALAGKRQVEADTVICPRSFEAASLAVGAGCFLVDQVIAGKAQTGFAAVRPPGHHALVHAPMGFCLFDNVAIAAKWAQKQHRLNRVLIIDFDVHHGNGTQDIFWDDGSVGFFSIHRSPFYPGTGSREETGTGKGLGMIRNVPVDFSTPPKKFIELFERELTDFTERTKPELIIVSAGFDAHREDPIGSLNLEVEDFATLTRTICQLASQYCNGKIVSMLEGGYHPTRLAESVEAHLKVLSDAEKLRSK